ncbi:MAG TPA: T9SS type A sorting domain-containing protein [Candidatus Acidoferrales bacterium]|nr:T9SS type A sorting domain-containing protein [Candidatus Acidoferrales bacterium]
MKHNLSFMRAVNLLLTVVVFPNHGQAQTDFWQKTSLPETYVFSIAANSAGYLFVRTPAIYRSTDAGVSWDTEAGGPDPGGGNPICASPLGYIVAGGYDQIAVSGDSGQTWSTQYTTYDYTGATVPIMSLAFNPSTKTVWAGTYGDGLHQVNGYSWYVSSTAFGTFQYYQGSSLADVHSVFCDSVSGCLFVSFQFGGAERSTDDGQSWSGVSVSDPFAVVNAWATSGNGDIFIGTWHGVFLSTDHGATFSSTDTTRLNNNVTVLVIAAGNKIYAGTDTNGVFLSTDYGESWEQIDSGLQSRHVFSLAVGSDGYLYAGTHGGGLYKSTNVVASVKGRAATLPIRFSLSQNYPNPFNPSTKISYGLPKSSFVTLKIYDVLGREVKTLVDERETAGDHAVTFNAGNLPSGVYFYRMTAGNFAETKKLMVIK